MSIQPGKLRQVHISFALFCCVGLLGAIAYHQRTTLATTDFTDMMDRCNGVKGQYYIEVNAARGVTAGCIYPYSVTEPVLPPRAVPQ